MLPDESVEFRELLIRTLGRERFNYIGPDIFVGGCPVCGEPLGVRFHGTAPRADLNCHGDCTRSEVEMAVAFRLRGRVGPRDT